jgi:hypothetical protein
MLEKVIAEITPAEVERIAREMGRPVSAADAAALLRDGAGAHTMWTHMMEAGRKYIVRVLETQAQPGR